MLWLFPLIIHLVTTALFSGHISEDPTNELKRTFSRFLRFGPPSDQQLPQRWTRH